MKRVIVIALILCVLIATSFVAQAQNDVQATVVAFELNVRSTYTSASPVIGIFTIGMRLQVMGREDQANNGGMWVYATPVGGGVTGWVMSSYLQFDPSFVVAMLPVMTDNATGQPSTSASPSVSANIPVDLSQGISGSTLALVNLRNGPGSRFTSIAVLPANLPVIFVGRNDSSTWLYSVTNGQQGWLSYTFVNVEGNVANLPIVGSSVVGGGASISAPPQPSAAPVVSGPPGVVPQITQNARRIFLQGRQMGNHPDVFSKVGDSITASNLFLAPIGLGGLQLYDYEYLRPVVDYFSQTPARDHYSFANTSLAARSGWTTYDVLDSAQSTPGLCSPGESPLVCEYRTNRPSIALIMFGTNDLNWVTSQVYQQNLQRIVQTTLDMGIIPVLSTIPDRPNSNVAGRVLEFNNIIRDITRAYDIPLWDYWQSLQGLPNLGLSSDNVHPSYDYTTMETAIFSPDGLRYGFNMRNLTALMVLDAIWRGAMY